MPTSIANRFIVHGQGLAFLIIYDILVFFSRELIDQSRFHLPRKLLSANY